MQPHIVRHPPGSWILLDPGPKFVASRQLIVPVQEAMRRQARRPPKTLRGKGAPRHLHPCPCARAFTEVPAMQQTLGKEPGASAGGINRRRRHNLIVNCLKAPSPPPPPPEKSSQSTWKALGWLPCGVRWPHAGKARLVAEALLGQMQRRVPRIHC